MSVFKAASVRQRIVVMLTLIVLMASMIPVQPVVAVPSPMTYYVDVATGDDVAAGTEAEPLLSITHALELAYPGDTVVVAPGTYSSSESTSSGETFPLVLRDGVTLISAGDADDTTIDPELNSNAISHADLSVLTISAESASDPAVIEGFTIARGSAPRGGGIYWHDSDLTVNDCVIRDCAGLFGAGVDFKGGTLEVNGTVFSNNGWYSEDWATRSLATPSWATPSEAPASIAAVTEPPGDPVAIDGGGLLADDAQVSISDCLFEQNASINLGGGLCSIECTLAVESTEFDQNYCFSEDDTDACLGGGAAVLGSYQTAPVGYSVASPRPATLQDCSFADNLAMYAGGLFADAALEVDVTSCDFSGNVGFIGDAICHASPEEFLAELESVSPSLEVGGKLTVDSSTFEDNGYVEIDGEHMPIGLFGTLVTITGQVELTNNVLARNAGMGTVLVMGSSVDMYNCTLAENLANYPYFSFFGAEDGRIHNSIFWGNEYYSESLFSSASLPSLPPAAAELTAVLPSDFEEPPAEFYDVLGATVDYSDLEYGIEPPSILEVTPIDTNISADPMFTVPGEDYSLQADSPCIDTGWGFEGDAPTWDILGTTRPIDSNDDGTAEWEMGAYEYASEAPFEAAERIAGSDRYATAVAICKAHFDTADTVVVVRGNVFADGLTSSGLAGVYDSPLLLTPSNVMPDFVASEIERLGASRAFIVGGMSAVSDGVESQLANMGLDVTRIGGSNRYETAALVAQQITSETGTPEVTFIARGDLFADALTVSPVAYGINAPILLVGPNELPAATVGVLEDMGTTSVVIAGGTAAVSHGVEAGIADAMSSVDRMQGSDRYGTSAAFSEYAYDAGWASFGNVGIATGETFPDALAGGCTVGAMGGVLMLTPSTSLHATVRSALVNHKSQVSTVEVFGGPLALSNSVSEAINTALAP